MKTIAKILFLCGTIVLTAFSCEKEDIPELSDFVEGYIVGSFQCYDSLYDFQHQGYCIIPVENNKEYLYTFSIQDDLIIFSPGIIRSGYDESTGGPFFFPDSLGKSFKIRFTYREPNSSEAVHCIIAHNMLGPTFHWEDWQQVICSEVTKVTP